MAKAMIQTWSVKTPTFVFTLERLAAADPSQQVLIAAQLDALTALLTRAQLETVR